MHKRFSILVLILPAIFLYSSNASAVVMDIDNSASQSGTIQPFSESNTATYGQRITVSENATLNSFSFFIDDFGNPVDFIAYVYEWDGNKATGSSLFASGLLATTNNSGLSGFEWIDVFTGGISLLAGLDYVLFFSTSDTGINQGDSSRWATAGNSYADGGYVYENNGDNFAALTTSAWDSTSNSIDMVFKADFSQIPVPAPLALMGLGLVAMGYSRKLKLN